MVQTAAVRTPTTLFGVPKASITEASFDSLYRMAVDLVEQGMDWVDVDLVWVARHYVHPQVAMRLACELARERGVHPPTCPFGDDELTTDERYSKGAFLSTEDWEAYAERQCEEVALGKEY